MENERFVALRSHYLYESWEYQQAGEQRRQLAVDVGELSQQLTDLLGAVGFTEHDARRVDVHALARATNPGREPGR